MPSPSHHRPDGRFRNPWPEAAQDDAIRSRFLQVAWEWITKRMPPDPAPGELLLGEPEVAHPFVSNRELRVTWIGHASFLLQLPGANLLTDPIWSARASPISFLGFKRFAPARPELSRLPRIQAVLLSHDHYDHLDRGTVRSLHRHFGDEVTWFTPLGYRDWFARLGVTRVIELDWWEEALLPNSDYTVTATPCRHWTRRTPWGTNRRLWCSWVVLPARRTGFRLYFGGDSGYVSAFETVGNRLGPFDVSLVPIGAYEPRWFMGASHMNPEEAVQAYRDLGGSGAFIPTHWGTFRLTFEAPLEPPERLRRAWRAAGLSSKSLYVARHGQTVTFEKGTAGGGG